MFDAGACDSMCLCASPYVAAEALAALWRLFGDAFSSSSVEDSMSEGSLVPGQGVAHEDCTDEVGRDLRESSALFAGLASPDLGGPASTDSGESGAFGERSTSGVRRVEPKGRGKS